MTKSGQREIRVRKVRKKTNEWGLCTKYILWGLQLRFRWAMALVLSFLAANPTPWEVMNNILNNVLRMDLIHFMVLCHVTPFTIHLWHHNSVPSREGNSTIQPIKWDLATQASDGLARFTEILYWTRGNADLPGIHWDLNKCCVMVMKESFFSSLGIWATFLALWNSLS